MNITNIELKALKRLLTKEDLSYIANKTKMSASAVNAVFYTRPNSSIEYEIIQMAKDKVANYQELLYKIDAKNQIAKEITIEEFERLKSLTTWQTGHDYYLMIDCYLQFSHIKFNSIEEIINQIGIEFKELINYRYRIVEVCCRLLGLESDRVVKDLNKLNLKKAV